MLDSCPAWRSCGGEYSYWSGDKMPTEVGVAKFVKTSYTLESGKCKESVWPMETTNTTNSTSTRLLLLLLTSSRSSRRSSLKLIYTTSTSGSTLSLIMYYY
ncbi:hypothetical protein EB796_005538 [Bugula neritina]|uniref:Uncharacterized protein n=1 Tax=Bugula neritina TaxID=10212 RepID=A0A7J7KEW5_BUGNE|nr:hypothetical protein EB796_005538 [Bugula neritina]